jgi:hypothetical protein
MRWRKITAMWLNDMLDTYKIDTYDRLPRAGSREQDDIVKINGWYYICEVVR